MEENDVPTALDERLHQGLTLLDRSEWFEAHEVLEELWFGEVGAAKRLVQALIQLAVALHHRDHRNLGGARALFDRASEHLAQVPDDGLRLDVPTLRRRCGELAAEAAEATESTPFPAALVPRFEAPRAAIEAGRRAAGLPPPAPPPLPDQAI